MPFEDYQNWIVSAKWLDTKAKFMSTKEIGFLHGLPFTSNYSWKSTEQSSLKRSWRKYISLISWTLHFLPIYKWTNCPQLNRDREKKKEGGGRREGGEGNRKILISQDFSPCFLVLVHNVGTLHCIKKILVLKSIH